MQLTIRLNVQHTLGGMKTSFDSPLPALLSDSGPFEPPVYITCSHEGIRRNWQGPPGVWGQSSGRTGMYWNVFSTCWSRSQMFGYAHMLIVVAFLVVKLFSFLVITRNPTMRFGPKLEEIFLSASRSFLYLSGTFLKAINVSFFTPKFSENIENNNDY